MTAALRELGFRPAYEVEVNPEFPPSGDWGVTEIRVGDCGVAAATLTKLIVEEV